MGDLLRRDPHVDRAEHLGLVYGAILLAPLVELQPRCFSRDIVYSADKRESYA